MNQNPQGWGTNQPAPGQFGYGQQPYNPFPPEDVEEGKTLAILGYLVSPAWIIPLIQRDNAFSLYHAKQAMNYTIIVSVISVVVTMLYFVTCGIGVFLYFGLVAFMYPYIMGIVNAANGEYKPMPWIGQYAEKWFGNMVADKRPGQAPPGFPQ